ncbi:polyphosphate polymerase domain-containing protein [Anaerotignum lactatifermentans]|uniref:Polyphosphate polymerase domain-containing protein n=1 Tax=Anaerotignum lactatifermentans TaxID=160404 RepID=A0ABS2GB94_9FIRM|nr:polyphosphate polymerase domain-containing protein [Anaerotignum lactatifermentans]MBM6830183.1 polyphosphate polymerase domain-containing protein [Anaerotignum lactatifermentans]MBM6878744.1 polyphosphate polymerase domain-containing protein [Anaerotignum lactatifermentans]MBM6951808.1 polyphosphate polymerase domain-containing protein [Anaerotignum lactatifermentans]
MNEVYRQEKKYFMTMVDMKRLSWELDPVMIQDAHNGIHGYSIRSLYFDTVNDKDYEDKINGLELRRKIRLRIYDPAADFAMLEMKQKEGDFQKKRSLRVSREDAMELNRGNYGCLLKYEDPFAQECFGVMHMQCYRPKTIVEYRRKAYIAKENKIRITFDHDIRATETDLRLFSPNLNMYPVLDAFHCVLEVKYNGFLLTYIKNLVNEANKSSLSVSKYCLARSASLKFSL